MNARIFAGDGGTSPILFWLGTIAVTVGVGFHIPMFLEAASMGYRLAGMAMDSMMPLGMALIVIGTLVAGYGLLPKPYGGEASGRMPDEFAQSGRDSEGKLTAAHWQLMMVLTLALIIDTMKPASLGFVVPGMAQEYGLSRQVVALLPFFALTGTALGSLFWGYLADMMGRRAAILLAAIMFIGTSICGAMPSFVWNIAMCFLMGISAGGMLPITYTLLAEAVPTSHRGWFLVLLGGLGLAGGYLAASGCAALLEPHFGWRIMWLLGLPTGLLLIILNQFIPESSKFLVLQCRIAEARAVLMRFGAALPEKSSAARTIPQATSGRTALFLGPSLVRTTATLNLAAFAWGLVNFGFLLWLPIELRANGFSVASSDALLASSSLFVLPASAIAAWMYAGWSTKWTLVVFALLTSAGSLGLSLLGSGLAAIDDNLIALITITMIGSNGLIAVLMPYSAENYPTPLRGRGTGFVAGSSKLGGIVAQLVSMVALVPGLGGTALILAIPVFFSAAMVGRYGSETRGGSIA